jgi:hypothetical protein
MNFAAVVGLCSVWATPFLRNNLQRHKRNQSAGDPLIEGETLLRVGQPPLSNTWDGPNGDNSGGTADGLDAVMNRIPVVHRLDRRCC